MLISRLVYKQVNGLISVRTTVSPYLLVPFHKVSRKFFCSSIYAQRQSCALRRRSGSAAREEEKKTKRQRSTLDSLLKTQTLRPTLDQIRSRAGCRAATELGVITANYPDLDNMMRPVFHSMARERGFTFS